MFQRIHYTCLIIVLFISPLIAQTQKEIRKINPPKLENMHLGQKILCHRPMRHGSPYMKIEVKNNQVIAHNYGHGGSGWTLGPGSASYVNNLLLTSSDISDFKKDTPLTIIGAGALGLFSAYDLLQKGFTNITIIADQFESLTSHNAGGLLAPVSMDNNPKTQQIINEIGIDAYRFYASIAQKNHPDFKEGAVIVPTYFENREDSGLEPYVGIVMQPAKDVILDFGNGTTRDMVSYDDGIFIDTAKMMIALTSYLKNKNIKFVQKKIQSFKDIKAKFIINCSGLGAGKLNNDSEMTSVQGHLIMLKNQKPQDLQYMILIYFKESKNLLGQKVKRSFYFFPKHLFATGPNDMGVIGGTFIEGADATTPNQEEFNIMLDNAKKFYGLIN